MDRLKAAGDVLHLVERMLVKQEKDLLADLRPELDSIRSRLAESGHVISVKPADVAEPPITAADDLAELMQEIDGALVELYGDDDLPPEQEWVLSSLRHGDLNALLQNYDSIELLLSAVGGNEDRSSRLQRFYFVLIWLSELQNVLQGGPIFPEADCGCDECQRARDEDQCEAEDFQLPDEMFPSES